MAPYICATVYRARVAVVCREGVGQCANVACLKPQRQLQAFLIPHARRVLTAALLQIFIKYRFTSIHQLSAGFVASETTKNRENRNQECS